MRIFTRIQFFTARYCVWPVLLLCVACTTPRPAPSPQRPSPQLPETTGTLPGTAGNGVPSTMPSVPPIATPPSSPSIPSAPITAPWFERPSAGAAALQEGVNAFQRGEYGRANNKLKQSFLQGLTNTPDLLRGYKTTAFLNCVTQRIIQCEKSFEAAIAVDRKFDLSPSERNHPTWGPVFSKVRKRFAM